MTRYLGIMNYKGGMGKTSVVAHVATGLALKDKRVLVIDLDPQGSIKRLFDCHTTNGTYELLSGLQPWDACITAARHNVDLIAGDERLFPVGMQLATQANRESVLKDKLATVTGYDYILIDSSPSFDILAQNVMMCADALIVPVAMDYLAVDGVRQLMKNVAIINKLFKKSLTIDYVVPTFYLKHHTKTKRVIETLSTLFSPDHITTPIRHCLDIINASGESQTVYDYNPKATAVADYNALVNQIVGDKHDE